VLGHHLVGRHPVVELTRAVKKVEILKTITIKTTTIIIKITTVLTKTIRITKNNNIFVIM
jgi:hypothetical protein